jgi:hypothetical protein
MGSTVEIVLVVGILGVGGYFAYKAYVAAHPPVSTASQLLSGAESALGNAFSGLLSEFANYSSN